MVNPANDIIQSMMQGALMGNMLRRAQTEQQTLAQERAKNEQQLQLNDLETRMKLAAVTRPVSGGAVEDTLDLSQTPGVSKSLASQMPGPQKVTRKADASRMVKYKGADGSVFEGELLTPAEQASQRMSMDLAKAKALQQIHNTGALDLIRGQQAMGESSGAIAKEGRTFQAEQAASGRNFQREMAGDQRTFQAGQQERGFRHTEKMNRENQAAATQRNREDNAVQDRRIDRTIAADDARARRVDHGEARAIQTQIDKLQNTKRELHAKRAQIGELSKSKDWKNDTKGMRTKGQGEYEQVSAKLREIGEQEKELKARMDSLYGRHSGPVATAEDLFRSYGK